MKSGNPCVGKTNHTRRSVRLQRPTTREEYGISVDGDCSIGGGVGGRPPRAAWMLLLGCPGSPGEKWPRTYEIACWRRVGTGGTLRMGAGGFRPSSTAVYIARQDRGFGDAGRGNPQIQQRFLRHRNKISLLPKAMIVQSLRGSANLAVDLRQGGAGVNDRKNHYVPGGCKCGSTFQNMRTGMVQSALVS